VPTQGLNTGPHAMSGKLVSPLSGDTLRHWPDESDDWPYPDQGVNRSGDIVMLQEILDAVEIDLDAVTEVGGERSTVRYDGLNILVMVKYEMVGVAGKTLTYTYTPRVLSNLEYKIADDQAIDGKENHRLDVNRHAIRLIFIQTGEIGRFDFVSLMVTLVTALGLLTVAHVITTLMMTQVLHLRHYYNWHLTDVTEDMTKIFAMEKTELDAKLKFVENELEHGKATHSFLALDTSSDGDTHVTIANSSLDSNAANYASMSALDDSSSLLLNEEAGTRASFAI
jgi:hypothetical protein